MRAKRVSLISGLGMLTLLSVGFADAATWDVVDGGNWSTGWDIDYPKNDGDVGTISSVGWTNNGQKSVVVDVTDVGGGSNVYGPDISVSGGTAGTPTIGVYINNSASVKSLIISTTSGGGAQNRLNVDTNQTLTVNNLTYSGWVLQNSMGGNSKIKWKGDGNGEATFGFTGSTELGTNGTFDFSDVTTLYFNQTDLGGTIESRQSTWIFGSTTGDQSIVVSNVDAGKVTLAQRTQSSPWDLVKVGANNVDATNVKINRNSLLNFSIGVNNQGKLFTNAAGGQAGGTVTIADYYMPNLFSGNAKYVEMDTLGSNLTVASGGQLKLADDEITPSGAGVFDDDVTALRVLAGNTVKVNGTGGILIRDANAVSYGRLGIYFQGSTLDSRGNLTLQGARTFLNGGTGATMLVGGNVSIQSQNAGGFTGLNSSPTDDSFDNFNLINTSLTMDGGGSKSISWDVGAALGGPVLTAGDFSLANFTLGTLSLSNNTALTLAAGQNLFLNTDLLVAAGSTLSLGAGSTIYLYDPDNSEYARLQSYLGTRLLGMTVTQVSGVGQILALPEPTSAALLAMGGLILGRRRRAM